MKFKGKHVLITGSSRGIGRAIAQQFAAEGSKVMIIYKSDHDAAGQTLKSLDGSGHLVFQCDISDADAVERLFDHASDHFGNLDVVINNAGICFHHPVDTSDYETWQEAWRKIMDINLIGPSNVAYQAARIMIPQGYGKIINVTSRGAFRGEPDQPAYGASKAGLNSLTQSLAYKLSPHNIFVGAVAPGFVETDMAFERLEGESGKQIRSQSPMNRVAKPEEVAQAVLLMAEANQWMTGGIFDVNGASYFRI